MFTLGYECILRCIGLAVVKRPLRHVYADRLSTQVSCTIHIYMQLGQCLGVHKVQLHADSFLPDCILAVRAYAVLCALSTKKECENVFAMFLFLSRFCD